MNKMCAHCWEWIIGYFVSDHGQCYHPDCFEEHVKEKLQEEERCRNAGYNWVKHLNEDLKKR